MEDGLDIPRPNRAPVRERLVRVPGYPDVDAMALHGLGIPGLVPMDMSEDDDSDEDDLNHDEVSACSSLLITFACHISHICARQCH